MARDKVQFPRPVGWWSSSGSTVRKKNAAGRCSAGDGRRASSVRHVVASPRPRRRPLARALRCAASVGLTVLLLVGIPPVKAALRSSG